MSEIVSSEEIEKIVGVKRHESAHFARAVLEERMVYILHSQECKDSTPDLRDCKFSRAMDNGINEIVWVGYFDRPVILSSFDAFLGRLTPVEVRMDRLDSVQYPV